MEAFNTVPLLFFNVSP